MNLIIERAEMTKCDSYCRNDEVLTRTVMRLFTRKNNWKQKAKLSHFNLKVSHETIVGVNNKETCRTWKVKLIKILNYNTIF